MELDFEFMRTMKERESSFLILFCGVKTAVLTTELVCSPFQVISNLGYECTMNYFCSSQSACKIMEKPTNFLKQTIFSNITN